MAYDGLRWLDNAQEHVRRHRLNGILDWTGEDPAQFAELMAAYRSTGFPSTGVVIAASQAWSRLGIIERYVRQREQTGHGRLTPRDSHDRSYRGIPDTCDAIDEQRALDSVFVLDYWGTVRHYNQLGADRQWSGPPRSREMAETVRSQPWTTEQTLNFLTRVGRLRETLGNDWHQTLDELIEIARPLMVADLEPPSRRTRLDLKTTAPSTRSTPKPIITASSARRPT